MSDTYTIDSLKLARELLGSAYQRHMAANPYCMSGIGSREAESVARDYIGAYTAVACCADELPRLTAERDALRSELERERMRLAACGVVALANTPESAAKTLEEARQVDHAPPHEADLRSFLRDYLASDGECLDEMGFARFVFERLTAERSALAERQLVLGGEARALLWAARQIAASVGLGPDAFSERDRLGGEVAGRGARARPRPGARRNDARD